ncbi:MAG: hypothetical protein JNK38_21140 [Acidobacteria bacterium]|nr:hypothetical protein [Acidobacteriota bacterium]
MIYQNDPNNCSEQEFDRFLREVDDLYGDAPGMQVPPDFVARVVGLAQAERMVTLPTSKSTWSFREWFLEFSLAVRLATAFALVIAAVGGVRVGQAVTEIIARRNAPAAVELADPLGLTASEQSIVLLLEHDPLGNQDRANRNSGERQ